VRRLNTTTPLQALMMMNDPTVLEAARVFAQKLISSNKTAEENIIIAFRSIICHKPTDKQLKILIDYYTEQLELLTAKKADAEKILKAGEYPQDDKADKNKSAALMKVITTIYNMEEAITKT
jgi:hypothetical protein